VLKDGTHKRISNQYAARKLKISRKLLRDWVKNHHKILNQKRGTFQAHHRDAPAKEPKMERLLNKKFEEAQAQGRKISYKWVICHTKNFYKQLHPDRVLRDRDGRRKIYLGFRFLNGWFKGFKRHFDISLRALTKRAQKSLEQLEPVL
jgi:hypothetical protein